MRAGRAHPSGCQPSDAQRLCGGVPSVTAATLPLGNQRVELGPRQGDGLVGGRSAVFVTTQALPELARCLAHAACQLGELFGPEEHQGDDQDDEEFDRPDGLHNPKLGERVRGRKALGLDPSRAMSASATEAGEPFKRGRRVVGILRLLLSRGALAATLGVTQAIQDGCSISSA